MLARELETLPGKVSMFNQKAWRQERERHRETKRKKRKREIELKLR